MNFCAPDKSEEQIEWDKENAEIDKLVVAGHTRHCACRQVWGDGECECNKRSMTPQEPFYRLIITAHVDMKKEYPGYDLKGEIEKLVKIAPGDKELIMKLVEEITK